MSRCTLSPPTRHLRTIVVALAIAASTLALSACEAEPGAVPGAGPYRLIVPALSRDAQSGIQGIVTIGPTCPVERPDNPCPDRAYPTTVIVRDSTGAEVARTPTDASGRFTVSLNPGDYSLTEVTSGVFPHPVTLPVNVPPDTYTFVHVLLDSGIR